MAAEGDAEDPADDCVVLLGVSLIPDPGGAYGWTAAEGIRIVGFIAGPHDGIKETLHSFDLLT